jgi:HAD superfamily hydrolase (TIGR01509 family)
VPPVALFDLDNTLVDREAAFRRWAEQFAHRRGLRQEAVDWLCEADHDGYAPRPKMFAEAIEHLGLREQVEDLIAGYWHDYLAAYRPDPEVTEAVRRLREAGWRIAIVTNGASTQHEKIARAGLVDLVDACCVSEEVGMPKPDGRIFAEALRRLGRSDNEKEAGWMVGDAPGPDIAGGKEAGLQTIWMHRGRSWAIPDFHPEVEVGTVELAVEVMLAW